MRRVLVLLMLFVVAATSEKCDDCERCEMVCLSSGESACYEEFSQRPTSDIIVIGKGDCANKYTRKCYCCFNSLSYPVCGSDNKTYYNYCELRCVSETNYGKLIKLNMTHIGHCRNYPDPGDK